MTTTELNNKINEGTKKYGSKNAYLCSIEYQMAYRKWQKGQSNTTSKKKDKEVEIIKRENGYVVSLGGNRYLAHTGTNFGMLSGMSVFKTLMQAKKECNRLNYKVK